MRGLLLKDLLVCKKYMRFAMLIFLAFAVSGVATGVNAFIQYVATMYFGLVIFTSFSYDDAAKWDAYGMTMPVARSETVLAKYILTFLLSVAGMAATLLLAVIFALFKREPVAEGLIVSELGVLGVTILNLSILLPLLYRFGAEKARLMMFVIFFVPAIALTFLESNEISLPQAGALMWIAPFLVAGVFYGSYRVSVRIFENKEL